MIELQTKCPPCHLAEGFIAKEVLCAGRQGHVQREEVGCGQSLIKRDKFDSECNRTLLRCVRVVCDDLHAQALGTASNLTSHLQECAREK